MPSRILSGPPANPRGQARVVLPSFVKEKAFAQPYYGFDFTGSELHAFLYAEGTYGSTRGTIGSAESLGNASLIHVDSEGLVGPGSLAFRADALSGIRVWDVEGAALYSHSYQTGFTGSPGVYAGGWVWWSEVEKQPHSTTLHYVRLWQARADLSSPAQVQQVEANAGNVVIQDATTGSIAATSTHLYTDAAFPGEVVAYFYFFWTMAGGVAHGEDFDLQSRTADILEGVGVPDNLGNSLGSFSGGVMATLAGGETDLPVSTGWPGTQAGTSQSGGEWSSYGDIDGTMTMHRGAAEAASPTTVFAVGNSSLASPPSYFYIKG